jgi:response regulator NasT
VQALHLCSASVKHTAALRTENSRLKNSLEELKVIDRAKCSLVAFRNMTEPQAHHYIEREAMNQRVAKKEVAAEILRYYDLL